MDYHLGVGFGTGAVSVVVLVLFLCFLVDFFTPFLFDEVSLFVSTDCVFCCRPLPGLPR